MRPLALSRIGVPLPKAEGFQCADVSSNGPLCLKDKSQFHFSELHIQSEQLLHGWEKKTGCCFRKLFFQTKNTLNFSDALLMLLISYLLRCPERINVAYLSVQSSFRTEQISLTRPVMQLPCKAKCSLKVNGCNLLLIDFLFSRGAVCQVQSPAMHGRQQTAPVLRTRGHQLAGCAGRIRVHAGLGSNQLLCVLIKANMVSPPSLGKGVCHPEL